MELADGWYAYLDDERALGPYATQEEAFRAATEIGWPVEC
jgi:hypothetical protein